VTKQAKKMRKLLLHIQNLLKNHWSIAIKRYRPEIQKFAGALQGQRARKGIFITTGSFSRDALEFSSRIDSKIVLIDGKKLVDLLVDHNIGVSIVKSYEMKKIDSDYFEEIA
jgi:restriction system protein